MVVLSVRVSERNVRLHVASLLERLGRLHDLGECRNWNEVSDLYSSWGQDMSKDYSTEAAKVIAIYTKRASDAAQERRPRQLSERIRPSSCIVHQADDLHWQERC